MARCKCKICGTQLNTTEAYKIIDKNGNNKYYCSASEFEAEEAQKQKDAMEGFHQGVSSEQICRCILRR